MQLSGILSATWWLVGMGLIQLVLACGSESPPPRSPIASSGQQNSGDVEEEQDGSDDVDDDDQNGDDSDRRGAIDFTLEDLENRCSELDFTDPVSSQHNQTLNGLPLVQTGSATIIILPINFELTMLPKVQMTASLQRWVSDVSFQVQAQPQLAQNQGEAEAARHAGPVVHEFADTTERPALVATSADWETVACSVQPTLRVRSELGAGGVDVSFNPPLPQWILPNLDASTYEAELAEAITFTGIEAQVGQSNHPDVSAGSRYQGTVQIRPIDSTYNGATSSGGTATITSDRAYEVTIDFGSPEVTVALGLNPRTRFYIDETMGSFKAVAVGGHADWPETVFVAP